MRKLIMGGYICLAGLLSGCALDDDLPLTGRIEGGTYTHATGTFQCPMPGPRQGFFGPVNIEDASRIVETTTRLVPAEQRKPWEPALREEEVYPARIVPAMRVRFTSAQNDGIFLETAARPLQERDTPDDVLRSGYSGGNLGLLTEAIRVREGVPYGMAIVQAPLFLKGRGYMGFDLWQLYLEGDEPGPDIDVYFNFVEQESHYSFRLRASSLDYLPGNVNPKDLVAVYDTLKADKALLAHLEERLWDLAGKCAFRGYPGGGRN